MNPTLTLTALLLLLLLVQFVRVVRKWDRAYFREER